MASFRCISLRTALLAALLPMALPAAAQSDTPVSVVTPERVEVKDVRRLTGTVTAERVSSLSARIDGVVADIAVDAGDVVSAGEVILSLDDELARLEQERVGASVREGRARLEEARRVSRESTELAASKNLPATLAEAAKADERITATSVARLEAEAALQAARLARHVLRAPFDGVVTARHVDPGEWVPTSGAVVDLVSLEALRFDVRAPQELYPLLGTGDTVTVTLDALPSTGIGGHVRALVPLADAGSRSFLLRIALDNAPPSVIPGMSGQVAVVVGQAGSGWSLPRDAIVRYPDGTRSVWVVSGGDANPVAEARQVRLGRNLGDRIEILDGLDGSERVIVRGNESLRDNQPVRVVAGPRG